jgi:hypothetical protein
MKVSSYEEAYFVLVGENMAVVTPKIEFLLDSTKPVEELKVVILTMANPHTGKQLEILKELDLWMGEVICNIEKQQAPEPKGAGESAG